MKFEIARNLDEYCSIIENIKVGQENIWYRGMSSAKYSLTPSLFREKRIIGLEHSGLAKNGKFYRKSEAIMKSDLAVIDTFIEHYNKMYPKKTKGYNLIDYLYIMQHYEIPTRLLDFSLDAYIALYFSVSAKKSAESISTEDEIEEFNNRYGFSDNGSSVHVIDPVFTNQNTNEFVNIKDDILNIDNIDIDVLSRITLPLCVETKNTDKRIVKQKGVFMLFGKNYVSYDYYDIFKEQITKIFIPNSCRSMIKKELKERMNISHMSIYPDIKGVALDIIDEIEDKYYRDCKALFG